MVSTCSDVLAIADSARTTQLLQAAFNVIDATLTGHGHRKYGFEDWDCHFECVECDHRNYHSRFGVTEGMDKL